MTFYNITRMYTASTGDSDIVLTTAVPGCLTLDQAGVSDSEDVYYGIITYDTGTHRPTGSEAGTGRYISSGTIFQRTTVETSTDSDNSAINLTGLSELFLMPTAGFFNDLSPIKAPVMWHDQSIALAGAALTYAMETAQAYGHFTHQNPPADSDEWENSFVCEAGTYTLRILCSKANNRGILDVYIDDVLIGAGNDLYNAAYTKNDLIDISSVVLTGGAHTLRGKVNGKNASSSNYDMPITKIWLFPASY